MRAKIIVNSKTVRNPKKIGERIKTYLGNSGIEASYATTEYSGHAEYLAENSDGYDTLVVVGGDGTVYEAVNGFRKSGEDKTLGIVPLGGGNDIARSLGIYSQKQDLDRICYRLCNGKPRLIDVGKFNDRYFVSSIGIGLVAEAVKNVDGIPRILQPFHYLGSALFSDKKLNEMKIYIDGRKVSEGWKMALIGMNTKYTGNGIKLFDYAEMDDGILNFLIVGRVSALEFLYNLKRACSGKLIDHPEVEYREGKEMYIHTEEPVFVQLDGELFKDDFGKIRYLQDIWFSVEPKSLRVIC